MRERWGEVRCNEGHEKEYEIETIKCHTSSIVYIVE